MIKKMEEKEIKLQLNLTLNEVNFILAQVAKEPYVNVVGLIDKIKTQASEQISNPIENSKVIEQELTEG